MLEKIKKDITNYWFIILCVIVYIIFMQIVFSTWCPIKAIFHIDCPGCGLTHATIYMFKGDFINAFKANYTVFLWWILAILFFIDRYVYKFRKNIFPITLIIVCGITILRYFFNLIT